MAYSTPPTVVTGDSWTAGNQNTYIRDNFKAGIPDIFTAAGDMPYATGANGAAAWPVGAPRQIYAVEDWYGIIGCSLSIAGGFKFYPYYTGLPNKVIWDTVNYDSDGLWDAADPDAVIIPSTGVYRLSGFINYIKADFSDYAKYLRVIVGPSDKEILVKTLNLTDPGFPFEYIGKFTEGDDVYLRVSLYAGSGGEKRATGTTYFVTYLGPES